VAADCRLDLKGGSGTELNIRLRRKKWQQTVD